MGCLFVVASELSLCGKLFGWILFRESGGQTFDH